MQLPFVILSSSKVKLFVYVLSELLSGVQQLQYARDGLKQRVVGYIPKLEVTSGHCLVGRQYLPWLRGNPLICHWSDPFTAYISSCPRAAQSMQR